MSSTECSLLMKYNSLLDKNLNGYFANTKMKKHLVKSGLVHRDGRITSETAYRMKVAKKEHRENVRDLLASAIVDKALDMERMRQYEVRKRLEELYKIELVQKVRAGRGKRMNDDLVAILSPRQKKSGGKRKSKSAAVTAQEKNDVKLPSIRFNERTKKMYYENPTSASTTSNTSTPSGTRGNYYLPNNRPTVRKKQPPVHRDKKVLHPHPPPGKNKKKKNVHRGLMLARSDNLVAHRVQLQSMAEVTMKYLGSPLNLTNDVFPSNKMCEVQIIQQHCGASTICVFRELLPANTVFTFVSRRHRGSPFGLTVYIDGIQNIRVSSCCEYKHKPGYKIGGKQSQFALIAVQGAAPCYRCQIRLNLIDNNKEKEPPEEKLSSSDDEESAMKSYDIIVSRAGRHSDSRMDRPMSASVTTQTLEDEDDGEQEDEREEEEREEEETVEGRYEYLDDNFDEGVQFAMNQEEALSSDLDSSDSSESETESNQGDEEEEMVGGPEEETSEEETSDLSEQLTKEDVHDDDAKESEKSDGVEASSEAESDSQSVDDGVGSDGIENVSDHDHTELDSDRKKDESDNSDSESTLSVSSKSSRSSGSDDEQGTHSEIKPADVAPNEESDADEKDAEESESEAPRKDDDSDTEVPEESAAEDEADRSEIEVVTAREEFDSDNEDRNEKIESSIEIGMENIDLSDVADDEDDASDGFDPGRPGSCISRESTMLTGNEDGEFDQANKTIQFNEEVDVVTYAKVDGTSTEEETPRSDDSDYDFSAETIGENITLANLEDDEEEVAEENAMEYSGNEDDLRAGLVDE